MSNNDPFLYTSAPLSPPTPPPARWGRLGCILGLVGVAALVCVALPVILLTLTPLAGLLKPGVAPNLGTRIDVIGVSGLIAPGLNDGPAQALVLTRQSPLSSNTSETRLAAVDTSTRQMLWQTAPLDPKLTDTPIVVNAQLVFFVNQQQLMAVRRDTGAVAWQAALSDLVSTSSCTNCLQVIGGQVAALSEDGTLQAFEATSGKPLWQAHASGSSTPNNLYGVGANVGFMSQDANDHNVLRLFAMADGHETQVSGNCLSGVPYAPVQFNWPDGPDLFLAVGNCVLRIDAQALKPAWSVSLKAEPPSGPGIFSRNSLFVAQQSTITALALDSGAARTVLTDPNYRFQILGAHGDDVIALADRVRGSTQYQVWAVNTTSSQVHWKYDLADTRPARIDPLGGGDPLSRGDVEWQAQPGSSGLWIIRFQVANNGQRTFSISSELINWDSGQGGGQHSATPTYYAGSPGTPDWATWRKDTLWMGLGYQLMAFDASQGKITFAWT